MSAVEFAREVLEMQARINNLEYQVERLQGYKDKYDELLRDSTDHSAAMLGNLFQLGMKLAAEKDGLQ